MVLETTRQLSDRSRRGVACDRGRRLLAGLALTLCLGVPLARSAAAAPMLAGACHDSDPGVIRADGLFHDGGPLYLQPTEPEANASVILTLRTYACDVNSALLSYRLSATGTRQSVHMRLAGRDVTGVYDLWSATIRTGPRGSLLDYRFEVQDGKATLWYGAYGVAPAGFGAGSFTITPGFHTPAWAQDAIFYQIFPDRFKNGNPHDDVRSGAYSYQGQPVLAQPWTALPENPSLGRDFFGGDLAGIMQELNPYLKQTLGVTALYLNPIFQSLSNHKYDTQDYFLVDPHFGSNADLVSLLRHAHSSTEYRGDYRLSVILDGVFNHTGDSIRWFNKEGLYPPDGAYNTRKSPWFSFYSFTQWPDQYDSFAGSTPSMPRLNYASAGVRDTIYRKPTSVVQTYLRPPYGIDGWRLDDANEVGSNGGTDDNQAIWQGVRAAAKGASPQSLLIGEYWNNAQPWLDGTQWDGAMNYYGFGSPVSEWITGQNVSGNLLPLTPSELNVTLSQNLNDLPRPAQLVMLNSLSTHDVPRFLYRATGNIGKLNVAQIVQLTYVGMPCIYYGDEIGMTGATDPDDRRPFDWNTRHWNRTVLNMTRKLIALRKATPALRYGSFTGLLEDDANAGYAYGRWLAGQRAVVVLNDDKRAHTYRINVAPVEAMPGSHWNDALRGGTLATAHDDTVTVSLPAYSGTVLIQTGS